MGLFSFLTPSKTVLMEMELDREDYEAFEVLCKLAQVENPDFDHKRYLGAIVKAHLRKHYGRIVKDMASYDKPKNKKRILRG